MSTMADDERLVKENAMLKEQLTAMNAKREDIRKALRLESHESNDMIVTAIEEMCDALCDMIHRFDDMYPKDCQPLDFKIKAIEKAKHAVRRQHDQIAGRV